MTTAELMQALADAGAPLEAIIIAVRAVEAKEAEIKARDAAAQAKRDADAERKRIERATKASTDSPRTRKGRGADASEAPPNDIYSNPQNPSEANASPPPLAEKVVSAWNAGPAANGARRAAKLDNARKVLLKARLKEHGEAELFQAMANLAASKFHCGENDRNWRADLGWFLKAQNFVKALEMAPAKPAAAKPAPREQFEALCDREIARWRAQGNEREALVWERKKRGEEPRNGNTGPPRSVGELAAAICQQAAVH